MFETAFHIRQVPRAALSDLRAHFIGIYDYTLTGGVIRRERGISVSVYVMAFPHLSDASVLEEKHSWVFQVPKSTCHLGEISPLLPAHLWRNCVTQWWHNPDLQYWDFALWTYKEEINVGKVVYNRRIPFLVSRGIPQEILGRVCCHPTWSSAQTNALRGALVPAHP